MANPDHVGRLLEGTREWNEWRAKIPGEWPDLSGARLPERDLRGAYFVRTNFAGADLSNADLRGANLLNTDFQNANLSGANLARTVLLREDGTSGPSFRGATLKGIQITQESEDEPGASFLDFAGAHGLDEAQADEGFLESYLSRAFQFAHDQTRHAFPTLVDRVLKRIRLLRPLIGMSEAPPQAVQLVRVLSSGLIEYLKQHPHELYNIRPRQFEEVVGELLASYGWDVVLTPSTRDGGYDLFAISKDVAGVKTSWIVECKKYAQQRKVGVEIARALYGTKMRLGVANAMLATTSQFTKGVHALKASTYDLELRDYEGVLQWINDYKPHPDGKLYVREGTLLLPGDS